MLSEHLFVDAGLVIHALHLADRAEAHQVHVAIVVGSKQGQMVRVAVDAALSHESRARRDIDLAADDRLDAGVLARLVKVDRAVHDAVVGHPDRGHLELGRARDHGWDAAGPIEQRVLGVVVEVDEGFWGVRHRFCFGWRSPTDSLRTQMARIALPSLAGGPAEMAHSGIREIANEALHRPGTIRLDVGQPDFPTPQHVKEAGKRAIDENRTFYTHTQGILSLREKLVGKPARVNAITTSPEKIACGPGGVGAIAATLAAVLEKVDEVPLPDPG